MPASGRDGVVDLAAEKVAELVAREPVGLPREVLDALCGVLARAADEVGVSDYPDPRRVLGS